MQTTASDRDLLSSRRTMLVLMSLNTLFDYLYCMLVGNAFGLMPVFGGALYMFGRVSAALARLCLGRDGQYLTRKMKFAATLLLAALLIYQLLLLAVFPLLTDPVAMWTLFAVALCLMLRGELARRLTWARMQGKLHLSAFWGILSLLVFVPLTVLFILFWNALPSATAWQALAGFALSTLLECYVLWRERGTLAAKEFEKSADREQVEQIAAELRSVNAYHAFSRLFSLVLTALQVTLVIVYTFIGLTTSEMMSCLLVALACTFIMRELTDFAIAKLRHRPALTNLLLVGLFLWIYGLFLFYRQLGGTQNVMLSYLSLGLSVSGLTVTITCMARLERRMADVAQFGLREEHFHGYAKVRAIQTELAMLVGQTAALTLLVILCIPVLGRAVPHDLDSFLRSFRPLMILPALLLLVAALVSTLHFPLTSRHFQKLRRWLRLKDEGMDNPALTKQLDSVVVKRHKNRFGLKLLLSLMRPLYYHKVIGKENVTPYEDGTMILICNHGEMYGPVVSNLYIPITFRPWVLHHMMDRDAIIEHMYQGTMVRQKWLPEKWKRPIIKMITPLLQWVFQSLDAIPVFRGEPRKLLGTFRLSVEAMQAGDNILLFPENAEKHHVVGQKGYATEGTGELYTGFAMLGPAYYAKTHRRAVFIPIYASKKCRTLTIGKGIVYRPEAPATEEKLRIVDALLASMDEMYQKELEQRTSSEVSKKQDKFGA